MAYKCLECGHIFEDGEQFHWEEAHGFTDGRYEKFTGCPVCRGAYSLTRACYRCRLEKLEDDLFDGICLSCLRGAVDLKTGLSYLRDRKLIPSFVFSQILRIEEPTGSSEKLAEWCEAIAMQDAQVEQLVAYIVDTDDCEAEDFANWLNAQEVRK